LWRDAPEMPASETMSESATVQPRADAKSRQRAIWSAGESALRA
jgi:hypothetical protein